MESLPTKIWESIKNGYNVMENGPQTSDELKTKVAIVSCLSDAIFSKVVVLKSAKEV